MCGIFSFMLLSFEDGRGKNVYAHEGQMRVVYLRADA
jgi:hypothetical protein